MLTCKKKSDIINKLDVGNSYKYETNRDGYFTNGFKYRKCFMYFFKNYLE